MIKKRESVWCGYFCVLFLVWFFVGCKSDNAKRNTQDSVEVSGENTKKPPSFGEDDWSNSPPDSIGIQSVVDLSIKKILNCSGKLIIIEVAVTGEVVSTRNRVYRIRSIDNRDGENIWTFSRNIIEDFQCGRDEVYLSSAEEGINAIGLSKGNERWTYKTNPNGEVSYKGGKVYFVGSGNLYSIVSDKEKVEWKVNLNKPKIVHNIIGPKVHKSYVFLLYNYKDPLEGVDVNLPSHKESYDESRSEDAFGIHIFERSSGSLLTARKIDGIINENKVSVVGGHLYAVATRENDVEEGFEREDKKLLFRFNPEEGKIDWYKNINGKEVVFGSNYVSLMYEGKFKIIKHKNGEVKSSYKLNTNGEEVFNLGSRYFYTRKNIDSTDTEIIRKYKLGGKGYKSSLEYSTYFGRKKVFVSNRHIYLYDGSSGIDALHNPPPTPSSQGTPIPSH